MWEHVFDRLFTFSGAVFMYRILSENHRKCELTKMLRQSFDPESKTYVLSTVSQDVYNSNTTIDVLNYITDMKKIKCVQKRQMPKIPKPVPRQLQQLLQLRTHNQQSKPNLLQTVALN